MGELHILGEMEEKVSIFAFSGLSNDLKFSKKLPLLLGSIHHHRCRGRFNSYPTNGRLFAQNVALGLGQSNNSSDTGIFPSTISCLRFRLFGWL